MKKLIFVLLAALIFTGCGVTNGGQTNGGQTNGGQTNGGQTDQTQNSYRQIGMDEAVAMMEREEGYIILDVRRPDEFAAGHIEGAINVANETIGEDEIPQLPDKDQLIMVYCRSGRRSKEAAEKLVALGYTNVVEFGGILDWTGEIVT